MAHHQKRIFFFDMDGTLITGSSAMLEIAASVGDRSFVEGLEKLFAAGDLNPQGMITTCFSRWGPLPADVFRRAFLAAPKLSSIGTALRVIRDRGHVTCLITMSPREFANHFLSFGFDSVWGSLYPETQEQLHDSSRYLSAPDKLRIATAVAADAEVPMAASVAFGDSLSDVPLFGSVGFSVALNADQHLTNHATMHLFGTDLREILTTVLESFPELQ